MADMTFWRAYWLAGAVTAAIVLILVIRLGPEKHRRNADELASQIPEASPIARLGFNGYALVAATCAFAMWPLWIAVEIAIQIVSRRARRRG